MRISAIRRSEARNQKLSADVAILRERSVYSAFRLQNLQKVQHSVYFVQSKPTLGKRNQKRFSHRLVRAFTPKVRMTPVYGIEASGKVKEPGAVFVPFVMEAKLPPEEKLWRRGGKTEFFVIGKYEKRKNQRMMLEVVGELRKKYPIHLTVAGECSTPAHQEYYASLSAIWTSTG